MSSSKSPMDLDIPGPSETSSSNLDAPAQVFEKFLDLPAELRLNVYRHALVDDAGYIIAIRNLPPCRPNMPKKLSPALLRTCKSVYNEALPILYQENTWMIRSFPPERCIPELMAYFGEDRDKYAGMIRRIFTVGFKGCTLDQGEIKERLAAMGIQWENLHVWAVRTTEDQDLDKWLKKGEDWLERADERKMAVLGLQPEWWDVAYRRNAWWACKKGSKGKGEMKSRPSSS
ncbi:hypothetical protein BDV96DRAFT_587618 [Lophiotrema nucula]|uniref:2EXR domain-containing protein n=1 Tax=Lophiotrema nucula TaxID=690887 RepID=A0A6A5YQC8_9PLEO|nr:hypothetical protein BDV96DRAFT_587618 [Lophiotrema nucula]